MSIASSEEQDTDIIKLLIVHEAKKKKEVIFIPEWEGNPRKKMIELNQQLSDSNGTPMP